METKLIAIFTAKSSGNLAVLRSQGEILGYALAVQQAFSKCSRRKERQYSFLTGYLTSKAPLQIKRYTFLKNICCIITTYFRSDCTYINIYNIWIHSTSLYIYI
ncbi:hypothetical protein I3842_03G054600 [Carya illinoinensis]|uniref:Uncharacterized protein n=1 Tax=Carya illinoinensis TaxID=32201 RepID=A0A922JTQ1_CARIL|nr:hypothetical protein I3842_03G054600 [Carya illinoinensis]